jgi:hypothetical protein
MNAVAERTNGRAVAQPAAYELAIVTGDLSRLTAEERLAYYQRTCESLGLNPLTKPFDYLNLNGKLQLYARKDCTEQLRNNRDISVRILSREVVEGCYVVTAQASTPAGRTDESVGAVPIDGLKGEARANAMMKAETKAKRRVTLSICGLGMLDETEVDTIPDARRVPAEAAHSEAPLPADPQPSPSMVRKEIGAGLTEMARLKGGVPADIEAKLLGMVKQKHGTDRPSLAQCAPEELHYVAESLRKTLVKARAEAEAGTAVAAPPKADPHPTLDREPGIDPEDDEPEGEEGTDPTTTSASGAANRPTGASVPTPSSGPATPASPATSGPRLPKPLVDRLESQMAEVKVSWPNVVARTQRDKAVVGRAVEAGTPLSALTLDEAGRLEKWLVDEKKRQAQAKAQAEDGPA